MGQPIRILVETGAKRVFASALDWPGWARSGRTEERAVEALLAYGPRYRPVAQHAGLAWPDVLDPVVIERATGSPTTDFGAPAAIAVEESAVPDPARAAMLVAAAAAAWGVLDEVAAVSPAALRRGPRGGGRDRDALLGHVLGAEVAYARKIGLTLVEPQVGDVDSIEANRSAICEVLSRGVPEPHPRRSLWPVPYAARRIAWHVLDHAWEMEDRRG